MDDQQISIEPADLDALTAAAYIQTRTAEQAGQILASARTEDGHPAFVDPPLDLYAWDLSVDLARNDVPIAALLAAALLRADSANAAKLRAAWPTLTAVTQLRYDAPGGRLAQDPA
ncbi:MAG: hypothetical protein ABR616_07755 [Dermatophilaceae bacterium]